MNAIDNYISAKQELTNAREWAALIGSRYQGGGGGIGKVSHTSYVTIEIYHQERDGARNYHQPSGEIFQSCLNAVVQEMGPTIIAQAIRLMEQGVLCKAVAAMVLADAIHKDADGEAQS